MDRGVWWATVHRVAKSWTRLKQVSTHTQVFFFFFLTLHGILVFFIDYIVLHEA